MRSWVQGWVPGWVPSLVSVLVLGLVMSCAASAQSSVDYVRDIAPIFAERCQGCHGPQVRMKGLRLDDPDSLSTVVIAGSSSASKLILRVSSDKRAFAMPPAGAPLTQKQITLLKTWIDEGARVPLVTGVTAAAPKASGAGHWSFQPVRKPALPAVRDTAWEHNSIDRFVLARLEAEGLRPSPEADRNTLLRRLSLDLIGLPPTPTEVAQFVRIKALAPTSGRSIAYKRPRTMARSGPAGGWISRTMPTATATRKTWSARTLGATGNG